LLTEDDYLAKVEEYGDDFYAAMGAEGIRELLRSIDLAREVETLRANSRRPLRKPRARSSPSA
jgi:DNA-directed RNA polymerase subunit beta'